MRRMKRTANWLPIDPRILPPLFHFGQIHGIAKVFIVVEMVLASLVVLGTFFLVVRSMMV